MTATAALETPEWIAYQAWQNPRVFATQGRAAWNGFANGHRIGRASTVSWESIGEPDREYHRDTCPLTCIFCEAHRTYGTCTACGKDGVEALGADELSRCCLAPTITTPEV